MGMSLRRENAAQARRCIRLSEFEQLDLEANQFRTVQSRGTGQTVMSKALVLDQVMEGE